MSSHGANWVPAGGNEQERDGDGASIFILPQNLYNDEIIPHTPPAAVAPLQPPENCRKRYQVCHPAGTGEPLPALVLPPNRETYAHVQEGLPSDNPQQQQQDYAIVEHPAVFPHPWDSVCPPPHNAFTRDDLRRLRNTCYLNQDGELQPRKTRLPIMDTSRAHAHEQVSSNRSPGMNVIQPQLVNIRTDERHNEVRARDDDDDVITSRSHDEPCSKRLCTSCEGISRSVRSDDIARAGTKGRHRLTRISSIRRLVRAKRLKKRRTTE